MKKFFKYIAFALVAAASLTGCENTFEEVTAVDLNRCLQPMNLSARVVNGDQVTFNWDVTKDVATYLLEVYTDEAMSALFMSKELSAGDVPVTVKLDADATYYYRVQGRNPESGLSDSKWAVYEKSIKTYAVRDNLYLKVAEKSATSVSLSWTTEVSDYQDVDRIEYNISGSESGAGTHELSADEKLAATATVDGLQPSREYVFVLYFKSAARGEVTVYTGADITGFTQVSSMDELRNAIKTAGAQVYLLQEGSPYTQADGETLEIPGALTIVGQETGDGNKPVIQGEFHITGTASGSIKFESVALDGVDTKYGFAIQLKNGGGIKDDVVLDEISFTNCEIYGYSKGLIYEWGQPMNVGRLKWESCYIHDINADGTGGGDVIDFRGTADAPMSTLGEVDIIDNTIAQGGRTFLRIDFPKSLGTVRFDNNTIWNICVSDNTNNAGIIGIQTAPAEMSFKNNLILAMGEKAKLGGDNTATGGFDGYKYWHGFTSSNNWYFDVTSTFFNNVFTESGFSAVAADPTQNAAGGLFNLTDNSLSALKVGASKWWTPYVEEPEDLTLGTVTGNHTWNFGNAKYFSGTVKKEMVRDLLYMNASGDNPIVVENKMLNFTAPTVTNKKGVPGAGYLAFKVAEPGSVVLKVEDPASEANHVTVGTGPVDGSSVTVKGGAMAIAGSATPTKIVISDITEECMVYVYVSGAASLSELAWSTDVSPVNTALPAPDPTASPASVTAGDATDIVISWESVPNAASYSVVFSGKTYATEDGATSYTIGSTTVGMLDAGSYTAKVYANPGADDIYNTESAAGVAAFAVLPKAESGGDGGTVVKNIDQLNAALVAGKDDIILAANGDFDFSNADTKTITPTASVKISGEKGATVKGLAFSLTSDSPEFALEGITFQAGDQGVFLNFDAAGAVMNSLTLTDVTLDGFTKSVIYGNSDGNNVDEVIFKGLTVVNHGTGQGMFDFRKGTYSTLRIIESTLTGGRDFLRMDAGVGNGIVDVSQNTLYNLNPSANSNGIFYVRSTSTTTYTVKNNLIHTVAGVLAKDMAAVLVPSMSGNFYYALGDKAFGKIDEATATAGGGVVLTTDPVKNAEGGDFTLVSGLAMSSKVGDPRWNPSYDSGSSDSFTVKSADEFNAAISAGKKEITLALEGSPYDLSSAPAVVVPGLRLTGEVKDGKKPTVILPQLDLKGELGSLVIEYLDIVGPGSSGGSNFLNTGGAVMDKIIIQHGSLTGIQKSILYGNSDDDAIGAIRFSDMVISDLGGGQGTFDIRKGTIGSLTIENSTVVGGRDFLRADAGHVTGSIAVVNNTLVDACGSKGNSNGILHVRSTPESFVFSNNLVMYPELSTRVFAKSGDTQQVPVMASNMFYNTDEATYWAGRIDKEQATANGGVVFTSSPVKDLAGGDYTLTDALALSSNVGDPRWNPNAGVVTTEITVSSVEEFRNAIGAGKTAVTLAFGDYDFRTADNSNGDISLSAGITIVGTRKGGANPTIHGAIQLETGISTLVLSNITFDGRGDTGDPAIGVAINVNSAFEAGKVLVSGCEFVGYTKSVYYDNKGAVLGSWTFNDNLVHGIGTGQGMLDIRKGTIGSLIVSNSTFYDGGRDFLRCDKDIAGSVAVQNNTFASCSIDAGNGLLWVRSCAGDPSRYTVSRNLFVNLTGDKTLLAKSGATAPVFSSNFFFNAGPAFWTGAFDEAAATADGGAVLSADPCTASAEFNLKVTDPVVKAALAGDPRWL